MRKIFLALALILLLFGCTSQPPGPDQNGTIPDQNNQTDVNSGDTNGTLPVNVLSAKVADCKSKPAINEREECIQALAVSEKNPIVCNSLEKFSIDFCVKEVATTSDNQNFCGQINTIFLKNDCFYNFAIDKSDDFLCEQIIGNEDLKGECKRIILTGMPDSQCAQITLDEDRDDCYYASAKDDSNPFLCKLITGRIIAGDFYRDNCMLNAISTFNTPAYCDIFMDEELKKDCFYKTAREIKEDTLCEKSGDLEKTDDCYEFIALEQLDASVCEKLSSQLEATECVETIIQTNSNQENCALATTYALKDKCNHDFGVDLNHSFYCSKISTGQLKDECFQVVAINTDDVELCKKIGPTKHELRDECLMDVSLATLEEKICEKINFKENYIKCYSDIAVQTNDITICDKIERHFFLNLGYDPLYGCYADYAIEKNLPEVCDLITPTIPKNDCEQGILENDS